MGDFLSGLLGGLSDFFTQSVPQAASSAVQAITPTPGSTYDTIVSGLEGLGGKLLPSVASAAAGPLVGAGINAALGAPTGGTRVQNVQTPQQTQTYSQLMQDYLQGQNNPSSLLTDPNLALVEAQNKRTAMANAAMMGMPESGQAIQAAQLATAAPAYQALTTQRQLQTQRAGQLAQGISPSKATSTYAPYTPINPVAFTNPAASNPYTASATPAPTGGTLPTPGTSAGNFGMAGGSTATQGDAGPNPYQYGTPAPYKQGGKVEKPQRSKTSFTFSHER